MLTRDEYQALAEKMMKAEQIMRKIEDLERMERRVSWKHKVEVWARDQEDEWASYSGPKYEFGPAIGMSSDDEFLRRAQARMVEVLLEEIDAEIARLEKELAKL